MANREDLLFEAKLAQQAERFDEMLEAMKKLAIQSDSELNAEERKMFIFAYKNAIGARKAAWKTIRAVEQEEQRQGEHGTQEMARSYKVHIGVELENLCQGTIDVLDKHLIPNASTGESKVVYYHLKGDCHRYLAQILPNTIDRLEATEYSLLDYKASRDISIRELPACHPYCLGTGLNFSVFYYEILKDQHKACRLAKETLNGAIAELDILKEEHYEDSTKAMNALGNNLALWRSIEDGKGEAGQK